MTKLTAANAALAFAIASTGAEVSSDTEGAIVRVEDECAMKRARYHRFIKSKGRSPSGRHHKHAIWQILDAIIETCMRAAYLAGLP